MNLLKDGEKNAANTEVSMAENIVIIRTYYIVDRARTHLSQKNYDKNLITKLFSLFHQTKTTRSMHGGGTSPHQWSKIFPTFSKKS